MPTTPPATLADEKMEDSDKQIDDYMGILLLAVAAMDAGGKWGRVTGIEASGTLHDLRAYGDHSTEGPPSVRRADSEASEVDPPSS